MVRQSFHMMSMTSHFIYILFTLNHHFQQCFIRIHSSKFNRARFLRLMELTHFKLNQEKFKQRDFYRLQHIEFLHQTNFINNELHFNTLD